jgi:hypothetical protein
MQAGGSRIISQEVWRAECIDEGYASALVSLSALSASVSANGVASVKLMIHRIPPTMGGIVFVIVVCCCWVLLLAKLLLCCCSLLVYELLFFLLL